MTRVSWLVSGALARACARAKAPGWKTCRNSVWIDWDEAMVIDPRFNQLQQALSQKADAVQREFAAVGIALQALGRKLLNARAGETGPLLQEQAVLRAK